PERPIVFPTVVEAAQPSRGRLGSMSQAPPTPGHQDDLGNAFGEVVEPERASAGLRERLFRVVPALESLRTYSLRSLAADGLAGLTVATVAVPQAMAYATIAGMPPHYGLYTAIVMTAVGALFDSSRQLINGPTNAISIALLSALAVIPVQDKAAAAVMLAL